MGTMLKLVQSLTLLGLSKRLRRQEVAGENVKVVMVFAFAEYWSAQLEP
jgi:hypothetical protein